jgi:hypothetical protein
MRLAAISMALLTLSSCAVPDQKKATAEGGAYVTQILEGQKGEWNTAAILPECNPKVTEADVKSVFAIYSKALGPLESFDQPKSEDASARVGFHVGNTTPEPDFKGTYKATLVCKKGPASFTAAITRRGEKWQLEQFVIEGDAIKKAMQGEETETKEIADRILSAALKNWDASVLAAEAAPKVLPKQAIEGLFTGAKLALGRLKKYPGVTSFNSTQSGGRELVSCRADKVEFERGKAAVTLTLTKDAGMWKVAGINFKSQ